MPSAGVRRRSTSAIRANGVGSKADQSKATRMPKQIRLNAFDMNCVAHQSPGLGAHPRDRAAHYNTLDYWVELSLQRRVRLSPEIAG